MVDSQIMFIFAYDLTLNTLQFMEIIIKNLMKRHNAFSIPCNHCEDLEKMGIDMIYIADDVLHIQGMDGKEKTDVSYSELLVALTKCFAEGEIFVVTYLCGYTLDALILFVPKDFEVRDMLNDIDIYHDMIVNITKLPKK